MKKKIAILGSTGSIGKSTLDVIRKDRKNFDVVFLSANNNYRKLIQQAKEFKVKYVLIKNKNYYEITKKILKKNKIKVYSLDTPLTKIIKKRIDFTMAAIVGIAGLQPTIDAIKVSKNVAIANKESIICGWEIISRFTKRYKTKILPVDSEHFSINELTKDINDNEINEIIITASGGPFLNLKKSKLNNVKPKQAVKHPNWKMGKKISVDSATLMNKVFEVVEACKIFKFNYQKYRILIHPQSYVHSIIKFKSGLIKMILYNSDMKIPISNLLYDKKNYTLSSKKIDTKTLNNLNFEKVDPKRFPSINLISKCLNSGLQTPTIINASNEVLVSLFLKEKIGFMDIVKYINKILIDKDFKKYARRKPKTLKDIKITDNWARLKTTAMCVR